MTLLIITGGGIAGALLASKLKFHACLIFLVNISLAAYLAILLAPDTVAMLSGIKGVDDGWKNAGAILALSILALLLLYKLTSLVIPDRDIEYPMPVLAEKLGPPAAGFLSGMTLFTLAVCCAAMLPPVKTAADDAGLDIANTSRNAAARLVGTINRFTFHTYGDAQKKLLDNLLPPPVVAEPAPAKDAKGAEKNAKDARDTEKDAKDAKRNTVRKGTARRGKDAEKKTVPPKKGTGRVVIEGKITFDPVNPKNVGRLAEEVEAEDAARKAREISGTSVRPVTPESSGSGKDVPAERRTPGNASAGKTAPADNGKN